MTNEGDRKFNRSVIVEEQDTIAIIRLNLPQERNPLSNVALSELEIVFSSLIPRREIKSVIVTGSGNAFASGANIRELQTLLPDSAREFAARGQRLFQKIADATQVTIAAINGYCMGGGLDLALACDLRVASPDAVFAHPGARLGIITGWGGTQRLHKLVGTARAIEMFTTARRVHADEAHHIGLIDVVEDNALECALRIASLKTGIGKTAASQSLTF